MEAGSADARNAILARLVPTLVHELNNALTIAGGNCQLARQGAGGGERRSLLDGVLGEIRRASHLISAFSCLARAPERSTGAVDLERALAELTPLLEPHASSRHVRLEIVRRGDPAVLIADPGLLPRMVVTLAVAAIEVLASGPRGGGTLRLVTIGGTRGVALCAILEADRALDGEDAAELGALAEASRSRLLLRTLGAAAAARLCFQRAPRAGRDARPGSREHPPSRGALLVIEPDPALADLVTAVLEESGFRVEVAAGAGEAASAARMPCELVLFDWDIELAHPGSLARIAACEGACRLALLSTVELTEPLPVLAKPFRPGELLDFVDRCLS